MFEYSKFDKEKIDEILDKAEEYAEENDYENALIEIKTGLVTYPKSTELKNKDEEYNESLNEQIVGATLAEANVMAEAGDYVTAIYIVKNAINSYGNNEDFQKAYDTYNAAYKGAQKVEVIKTADAFAVGGDLASAIKVTENGLLLVGEDDELKNMLSGYQTTYVDGVCSQVDVLKKQKKYDNAIALLNDALTVVKNDERLEAELASVKAQSGKA